MWYDLTVCLPGCCSDLANMPFMGTNPYSPRLLVYIQRLNKEETNKEGKKNWVFPLLCFCVLLLQTVIVHRIATFGSVCVFRFLFASIGISDCLNRYRPKMTYAFCWVKQKNFAHSLFDRQVISSLCFSPPFCFMKLTTCCCPVSCKASRNLTHCSSDVSRSSKASFLSYTVSLRRTLATCLRSRTWSRRRWSSSPKSGSIKYASEGFSVVRIGKMLDVSPACITSY